MFQFGPSKFFPLENLFQMKKMEKLYGKGPLHAKKIWVPKTTVFRQAVHGSGYVEKKGTESECAFRDRSKTKAHMRGDQLQSVPDSELFGVETEYKSGEDSDCTDIDVPSQSSDEIEDGLPFVCDQCNKNFNTVGWFTKTYSKLGFTVHLCR